jgi:hypothetical protein
MDERTGEGTAPSRRSRRGLIGSVLDGAGGIVRSVASDVAPGVVDAVDVDEIVRRIDIWSVVDRIDLDDVVDRLDAQALLDRVDLEALLDRVDINHLIDRIDINRVLDRVDVNRLLDRIDVNHLVDRVDVNDVLGRVDVDALIARADADRMMRRVDVDAAVRRVDINVLLWGDDVDAVVQPVDVDALVERTELGNVVARSGAGVISSALDLLRSVGVGLDLFVHRWVDRMLRRDSSSPPGGPRLLVHSASEAASSCVGGDGGRNPSGTVDAEAAQSCDTTRQDLRRKVVGVTGCDHDRPTRGRAGAGGEDRGRNVLLARPAADLALPPGERCRPRRTRERPPMSPPPRPSLSRASRLLGVPRCPRGAGPGSRSRRSSFLHGPSAARAVRRPSTGPFTRDNGACTGGTAPPMSG